MKTYTSRNLYKLKLDKKLKLIGLTTHYLLKKHNN